MKPENLTTYIRIELFEAVLEAAREDTTEGLAEEVGMSQEHIDALVDGVGDADTVTFFFEADRWYAGLTDIFGSRCDAEAIPTGSVVCGFVHRDHGGVIDPPAFKDPGNDNLSHFKTELFKGLLRIQAQSLEKITIL